MSPIFHFMVGNFRCMAIRDIDEFTEAHFNVLLIDTGAYKIVVDAGSGHDCLPGTTYRGRLLDRLLEQGISSTDVDFVIFSHGDFDHVCGGVDPNGNPAFAAARYVMSQAEWLFWTQKPERLRPGDAFDEALWRACSELPPLRLAQLHDKLDLVAFGTEIVPGIRILGAPGHTPGHVCISIASDDQQLLCIGDLVHSIEEIEDPERYDIFDYDQAQVVAIRNQVFAKAAHENTLLMGYHLPFPGLGYVRQHGQKLAWTPRQV
jgi:glyoxylase-like metal-dependent hydrolase (beta-lactamase superfamily II)